MRADTHKTPEVRGRFTRLKWGAATATAVLMLGACVPGTGGGDSDPGPADGEVDEAQAYSGTVEWWTINLQANYQEYIQGLIDDYEDQHPDVTIDWVDVPGPDITTRLLAAIASGDVPDAVNINSNTMGLFADSMTDLNQYFTEDELGIYHDALRDPLTNSDGGQAAIPWYNGGANLAFYRLSAVEEAGFDRDNPPTTWDEALTLAQSVYDETGIYGTNAMAYSWVMQSEGVQLISDDGTEAAFNTPEAVALLEKYGDYYESNAIAPGVIGPDQRSYDQNLENEQIAFMASTTSTVIVGIESNAPTVYEDLLVAPAVTGPSGQNYLPAQQVFGIPQASDNRAAAAQWLKHVTAPEVQLEFTRLAAIYPSTPETLEDAFFTDNPGETPAEQARQVLVDTFETIADGALGTSNDELLRELFDEEVRAFILGEKDAQQALDDAEAAWNAELTE